MLRFTPATEQELDEHMRLLGGKPDTWLDGHWLLVLLASLASMSIGLWILAHVMGVL